ncbi:MAG: hypothetical protein CL917_00245 [Deltaproteobacteria bacterium]|nr:hypothetical protein [Deltaproteobacteria bacterium]
MNAWRMGWLVAAAILLAVAVVLFGSWPESAEPSLSVDALSVQRERTAVSQEGASADASKNQVASPSSTLEPREPVSPPDSRSALRLPSSSSRSQVEARESWRQEQAEARERLAEERSRRGLEDRDALQEGQAEPEQLRRLGALARADELRAAWAAEAELIDELGPEAYDELLYEQGRDNRSQVQFVAERSNAGQAGIQKGDVILSYGEKPVFAPRSLRETNRLFPPGGEIVVQVDRDGQILEFTMGTDDVNRDRSGIVNGMVLSSASAQPD